MKNALALLIVSQGVPMILMGDEVGRTQNGNNNTYCHDNELNWMNWTLLEKNADLFRFTSNLIAFRNAHPVLRSAKHPQNRDYVGSGYADITWHGTKAWQADWSASSRLMAFMLDGRHARGGTVTDNTVYVAMNMHWEAHDFELPGLPAGQQWHVFANTGAEPPEDSWAPGNEPVLSDQGHLFMGPRSVAILVAK
jgi:glycogen operon protein